MMKNRIIEIVNGKENRMKKRLFRWMYRGRTLFDWMNLLFAEIEIILFLSFSTSDLAKFTAAFFAGWFLFIWYFAPERNFVKIYSLYKNKMENKINGI